MSDSALVRRSCPSCESAQSDVVWRKGELVVVRCRGCQLYYADPVAAELASGQFYDRLGVPFYLSPDKLESDYAPVRFRRELKFFQRFCPSGRVLDVGCSTGAFLYQLGQRPGYEGVGMDVTGPALDYAASRGVTVIRESFLEHDFGATQFDAVTFWAVVEHLTEPLRFLQRAAEVLRPGGHCVILVPNLKSLAIRLLGARYRYVMPDHVNYFSRETLVGLLGRIPEFEVVHHTTMMFNPIVIWQDMRRSDDRVPDAERARLLKRTTGWKQSPWLAPVRGCYAATEALLGAFGLADNLVVVVRKREVATG